MIFDERLNKSVSREKALFFPTATARDGKFNEIVSNRRAGMLSVSLNRAEQDETRAMKVAFAGVPWQTIFAGYLANLKSTGKGSCTALIEPLALEFIAMNKALLDHKNGKGEPEPKLAADSFRHTNQKITLFNEEFGHVALDRVLGSEIVEWIDGLDGVEADVTFDNYVKHVRAFYNWCINVKKLLRDNPCTGIKGRFDGIGVVGIISVEQTAQLFQTAMTYKDEKGALKFMPAIGRLAVEAFIGFRHASSKKMVKADINFVDKGITLPKKNIKTKRRYYIDRLPDQLWEWLAINPDECWDLTHRQYMGLKSDLFTAARVPHPSNCLRHNFATYHVAAYRDAARTAHILCHRDQAQLYAHYLGIATSEQGERYQSITPRTAAKLAQGFVPDVPPVVHSQPQPLH